MNNINNINQFQSLYSLKLQHIYRISLPFIFIHKSKKQVSMGTLCTPRLAAGQSCPPHNQLQRANIKQNDEKQKTKIPKSKAKKTPDMSSNESTIKIYRQEEERKNKSPSFISFIWINKDLNDEAGQQKYLESEIEHPIFGLKSVKQAKKQLSKHENVVVICSLSLAQQVQDQISKNANVKSIICYCMNVSFYQKLKKQKKLGVKFKKGTKDQKQVIDFLKNCLQSGKKKETIETKEKKEDNTFVILNNKVEAQNILIKTISAIIQENIEKGKKSKKNYEDIIRQYKSSSLAQVTNSFYNINTNFKPLCTLQPYIKKLFQAIKQSYQTKFVGNYRKFTCFRFDAVPERQIQVLKQGVGQILKNSGFIQAYTKIPQIASDSNVLFEINYVNQERKKEIDYGFAEIREQNMRDNQNIKILFNCLNTFMVTKVEQKIENKRRYYLIRLQYGQLAKIMSLNPSRLNPDEGKIYELGLQEIKLFSKYNSIVKVFAN